MEVFNFRQAAQRQGTVDRELGTISGVSVISTPEAKGHGIKIDAASIESFYEVTKGKQITAYYTHDDNEALDAIGIWHNFAIVQDGEFTKLQADFEALDAWKTHHPDQFDSLFELAEKAPESFGVSAEFSGKAIYYSEEGEEIEYKSEDEEKEIYARAVEVSAFSIVAQPAANPTGLFSEPKEEVKEVEDSEVDAEEFLAFNLQQVTEKHDEQKLKNKQLAETIELQAKQTEELQAELDEVKEAMQEKQQELEAWQIKFAKAFDDSGSDPVESAPVESVALTFEDQLAQAKTWSEKSKLFNANIMTLVKTWDK